MLNKTEVKLRIMLFTFANEIFFISDKFLFYSIK